MMLLMLLNVKLKNVILLLVSLKILKPLFALVKNINGKKLPLLLLLPLKLSNVLLVLKLVLLEIPAQLMEKHVLKLNQKLNVKILPKKIQDVPPVKKKPQKVT